MHTRDAHGATASAAPQGAVPDRAVVLLSGLLRSEIEEEAGTSEIVGVQSINAPLEHTDTHMHTRTYTDAMWVHTDLHVPCLSPETHDGGRIWPA